MYRNMDNCTGHIPVLFTHSDVLKRWYSETSFRCTFFGTLCWASSDCSQFHMYACLWPSPITRGHPVCLWRWEHLEVTVHGGRQIRTFIAAYFTLESSKILLAGLNATYLSESTWPSFAMQGQWTPGLQATSQAIEGYNIIEQHEHEVHLSKETLPCTEWSTW